MADHGDARWVAAQVGRMAPRPGQRAGALQRDVFQCHRRCQCVVRHHHRRARGHERRRHEREIRLVQRPPVAAVHEHQHRRAGRGAGEDVQRLVGAGAVGQSQPGTGAALACQARRVGPALQMLQGIGHTRPVVVLGVEPGGIVTEWHAFLHIGAIGPCYTCGLTWGRSSAGRASRSQCEGQEFDPPRLHQNNVPGRPTKSPAPQKASRNQCLGAFFLSSAVPG